LLAPDDVAIMNNLSSHKTPTFRIAILARGAHLLLRPPFSPDLNPFEKVFVFAMLKHLIRKVARQRQGES